MSDQSQRPQRDTVPSWVLDALLSVAVALVIALVISADYGGEQDPDAVAYLIACGFGALMLVRRRFPVAVLVATMFLLFGYYILDYPVIGLAVPVAAALYSAAEGGHLAASVAISLILLAVSTFFRLREGEAVAFLLGYELITSATLMAAAVALGEGTRARRALRAEQAQTARLIAREQAFRAEQRVQAERVGLARDLHDAVGHSMSVISLHADVAREAIGVDDTEARDTLARIRAAASETMRELRATVKVLRSPAGADPDRSVASLAGLSILADSARASGLVVDVRIDGAVADLPSTVDTTAYRIVQESLTNVMRHAEATRVTLEVAVIGRVLRLHIADDGAAPPGDFAPGGRPGTGIKGMAERVNLLGGTLTAGPRPEGGFAVEAVLPLEEAS